MRRRISLIFLAALMVLPAVAPVRAAKPVPTEPAVASAEPAGTPEATAEPTPEATAEPTPEATPEPTAEPVESAPPEASPEPEPSDPPAEEPTPSPDPAPAADETPATTSDDSHGRPDATGRFIVLLDEGIDTSATLERMGRQKGIKAERTFGKTIRGFSARLDAKQRKALKADPSVFAVVPDEVIQVASQTTPTGVARVFTKSNTIAKINGVDERVDADVAIVDTGIQPSHPDLNVVGGYNCSTSNRAAWRDVQNHGTHVAGTVGAKDNTIGVVGVAPGARLWAVKILNDDGYGLLSWYVCGLDWILAQRDPADPSRPLIEAANMSVAKSGDDDPDCGVSEKDVLHLAICRVVKGGITVVAAAGNDQMSAAKWVPAAYNEVITVSALADTDGKPGALGGHRCYSWGSYDSDDTYANFSNYGSDVDIIAPGKCIWSTKPGSTYGYMSGTSMATPAVTGAAALYKASRPKATPAEVREALQYLGNLNWKTSTDPDSYHEKLLDVAKLGPLGTFTLGAPSVGVVPETGGAASVGDNDQPQLDVLRACEAVRVGDPQRMDRAPRPHERVRLDRQVGVAQRHGPGVGAGRNVPSSRSPARTRAAAHSVVAEFTAEPRHADGPGAHLGPGKDKRCPQRQVRADGHHLARGQRPVELDRGIREPGESRRRRLDRHDRDVRLGPDGGPQPGVRQLLPVPCPRSRRGRQLEHVGRHERAVPCHTHERP